ncbi:hypothetical protein HJG60_011009 [Phyllostomus discolor]|uniref:Uncharacterized protein n=1 Tax=Phyllostomus discolor TaxID=89673 RepID=A0A834A7F1_9CHIR|nr:hypothetical protein HJG60_011009 [Phyllostomus discolor]
MSHDPCMHFQGPPEVSWWGVHFPSPAPSQTTKGHLPKAKATEPRITFWTLGMPPLNQIFYSCFSFQRTWLLNFVTCQRHNVVPEASLNKHRVIWRHLEKDRVPLLSRGGCSAGLGAWSQGLAKLPGEEPALSSSLKKTGAKGGSGSGSVHSEDKDEA